VLGDPLDKSAQVQAALRRRWLYLMPVVFVTYSLAYLGRSNFGFGAAAGLAASLHITESRAAFLGSVFFLGYFLFQVPAASYAVRRSATRLVFFALISWGVLSGLTGIIRNYWLLVADRLLLGVAESLIFPSMLILLTHWFTRTERSRANAILILGNPVTVTWMAAVTGYLIRAVGWQTTVSYTHLDVYKRQRKRREPALLRSHVEENEGCPDRRGRFFSLDLIRVGHKHRCAFGLELPGNLRADSSGGAGDQGDLAGKMCRTHCAPPLRTLTAASFS